MAWMITEDRLTEEQRQFIDIEIPKNRNQWIRGYAGSGKSVLLVHGIHDLIRKNSNIRICIIVFTHSLRQLFIAGLKELKIPEQNVYICTYHQFRRDNYSFDYIFCDEVQDLPKSILEKMKANAKYVISGGDENQSIYKDDPQPPHEPVVTPSEISTILNADTWNLTAIYRLTKSVIKAVSSLIPSMNILSSKTDNTKTDVTPNLLKASTKEKEVEYILSTAKEKIGVSGQTVVVILPGHDSVIEFINIALRQYNKNIWDKDDRSNQNRWGKPDFNTLNNHLVNNNIDIEYIGNNYGDLYNSGEKGKIIVMTYHSSKGLDFDNVFLPFMGDSHHDRSLYYFTDTLFMVGMTRSKLALYITYSGKMHEFIERIAGTCNKVDIDKILNQSNSNNNFDDDFDF
jgi:superfamily I DNA/RNA helicase